MANDVKWIKIATDIFDDEKISLIESMPDADSLIVIWFKILTLAGKVNTQGVLMINDRIPYTEEMLSSIFRRKLSQIRLALETFEHLDMVEIVNGVVTIPNWSKHQKLDAIESKKEYMKEYMRNYRDNQKQLALGNGKVNSKTNSKTNVNSTDILSNSSLSYFANSDLNNTFKDFIKMRKSLKNGAMTERAIEMMIKKLNQYEIEYAIKMLNQSIVNNWKDVYELKDDKPIEEKKEYLGTVL